MIRIIYVTITYNAAATLRRTLDSILRQDYPHIQHLIIDGTASAMTWVYFLVVIAFVGITSLAISKGVYYSD